MRVNGLIDCKALLALAAPAPLEPAQAAPLPVAAMTDVGPGVTLVPVARRHNFRGGFRGGGFRGGGFRGGFAGRRMGGFWGG
ncbi:hypothetical protein M446_1192 [Methylobacterium sp. 4-46]|nr:hypothetical protein M446_1192 [Methylobacterium sp. 4-46]